MRHSKALYFCAVAATRLVLSLDFGAREFLVIYFDNFEKSAGWRAELTMERSKLGFRTMARPTLWTRTSVTFQAIPPALSLSGRSIADIHITHCRFFIHLPSFCLMGRNKQ